MKILFCGTQVPEKIEYKVKNISAAGNRFQNNLIDNMKSCGHEVKECAYIGVPVPETIRIESEENTIWKDNGFLKSLSAFGRMVKKLLDDSDAVMCYNITYAWISLPFWAKRRGVKSIAVIADYSEAVSYRSLVGKLYAKLQGFSMRRFDTVVGLSANISGKLKKRQNFILMEGGIDRKLYDAFTFREHTEGTPVILMYSGLLSTVTGVDKLLEVMRYVENQKIQLLLTGKGELEPQVQQAAQEDSRICYLGHLPYEEYICRINQADILINPRNMALPENQNNFPSKIMDYLASGKKIISTKFIGWEKFRDYIIFCDTYEEMTTALEKTDRGTPKETFNRNRMFAEEFLWEKQLERILEEIT